MNASRVSKLRIGLLIFAGILLAKLFYIQIIDDRYKINASNNSMVYDIIYPTRGIIYDRNGKIIVGNKVAYDILVTPKEVEPFDTVLLADVLKISPDFIRNKMSEYRKNRRRIGFQSMVMLKQIPSDTYMRFAEVQYKFKGFKGQIRSIRDYPVNAGGNLLGYVSEVDQSYIKKHPGEYRPGDYAGKTGIEAAREKELRGEKGYQIYLRNSHNQIQSRYRDGEMDKEAIPGKDVVTTIDADLQQYGQELMKNKVGSLVAIEPSTGEILTMVSMPWYRCGDTGRYRQALQRNRERPAQAYVQQGGAGAVPSGFGFQTCERPHRHARGSAEAGIHLSLLQGLSIRKAQAGMPRAQVADQSGGGHHDVLQRIFLLCDEECPGEQEIQGPRRGIGQMA